MDKIDYHKLGERIKTKRRECGYTQEELAEICDISTGFLGHIESGSRSPSLETLYSIACALHCGVDHFLIGSAVASDVFFEQLDSYVQSKNPDLYCHFRGIVKVLAEHIDEI